MLYEEKIKHIKSEMNQTLVSIITPLYNSSLFISHTISSVLEQTHTNWEHIIIDDASTDNSASIVEQFAAKDPRISLIKLPKNTGAANCRNHATKLAKGSFIAFLDSDDLWTPTKLEKQLQIMAETQCAVSFTSYRHIDLVGNPLGKRIVAIPSLTYKKQHRNNYIGNLTGMYNVEVLGKILAPNIRKRQDWAVWLEAIKRNGKAAIGIQEDLAFYRVREGSISSNKLNLIKYNFRFYREHLGYTWIASIGYLFRFFWEYFFVRPKYIQKL